MAIPELYKPSREGRYFTLWQFFVFMFDGVVQVSLVHFVREYALRLH